VGETSANERHRRWLPVTPEVAGSSPVAPIPALDRTSGQNLPLIEGHLLRRRRTMRIAGSFRADDGTRTHDLLHGKCERPFAPVRSRSLKRPVCGGFGRSGRTRANPSERRTLPFLPRLLPAEATGLPTSSVLGNAPANRAWGVAAGSRWRSPPACRGYSAKDTCPEAMRGAGAVARSPHAAISG
jgi:hypothetical protein